MRCPVTSALTIVRSDPLSSRNSIAKLGADSDYQAAVVKQGSSRHTMDVLSVLLVQVPANAHACICRDYPRNRSGRRQRGCESMLYNANTGAVALGCGQFAASLSVRIW